MKQYTLNELLERMVPDRPEAEDRRRGIRSRLKATVKEFPDAAAVVLFENKQMDSSRFGEQKVCVVGPGCTIESVEDCEGRHLGDLPSQRLYPEGFVPMDELRSELALT